MSGNPMQDRCGAHCRTTGQPCLNFPMANGRCRMHGGKSSGRPITHGHYTQAAVSERKSLRALIKQINQLVKELEGD